MDLLLKNGLVVSDGLETAADLAVRDGVVRAIGSLDGIEAREVVDCSGKIILPGAVDIGLNLLEDGPFDPESASGFALASRHAALGGVTSLVTAVELLDGEDVGETLRVQQEGDARKSVVDFGYHLVLDTWNPKVAARAREAALAGICSFWARRTGNIAELPSHVLLMVAAQELPEDALLIGSVYDPAVVDWHLKTAAAVNYETGSWKNVLPEGEEAAFVLGLPQRLKGARARVLLTGLSSAESLQALRQAREQSAQILAGCKLPHLYFQEGSDDVARTYPPVRGKADQQAIFNALEDGLLSVVTADHKPRTLSEMLRYKEGKAPVVGMATLSHFLPVLHSEGVAKWRLSLGALSQCACADPAKLAGLYPRKGCLQIGSDADMVILDPQRLRPAKEEISSLRNYVDPLGSAPLQGYVEAVYLRGQCIVREQRFLDPTPTGRFLPRKMALK